MAGIEWTFHVHCSNAFVMYIININVERQISFFEKTEYKTKSIVC